MSFLVLQLVRAIMATVFGGIALVVARRLDVNTRQQLTWLLTGLAFLVAGSADVLQALAAAWAYFEGPGTPFYAAYLVWLPIGNHGRSFIKLAFTLLLLGVPWIQRMPRPAIIAGSTAFLLAGAIVGGGVGWMEGGFQDGVHFARVAMFDAIEMIGLLAMLVAMLFWGMDRLLWVALVLYAIRSGLNGLWFAAMSWANVDGVWAPPFQLIARNFMISLLVYAVLVGITLHRLRLARRGVHVPSLLEPLMAKRVSSLH